MSRLLVILACVWSLFLACKAKTTVRVLPGGNSPKTTERFAPWLSTLAGMPFEQAMDIFSRHRMELQRLPGVDHVGLGPDGIKVYTTNPAVVPTKIEGLPVIARPPWPSQPHMQIRPLIGNRSEVKAN